MAIPCGADVSRRLRREAERFAELDRAFRAPSAPGFHLTVQFIGDTDEDEVPGVSAAIEEVARSARPVEVAYVGLGAFPNPGRARVVWAAVREVGETGVLEAIARDLGRVLARLGHPPETRDWRAHVTLGRLRGRPGPALVEAVGAAASLDLGRERVSDLAFIVSEPAAGGYRYRNLTVTRLGGAAPL